LIGAATTLVAACGGLEPTGLVSPAVLVWAGTGVRAPVLIARRPVRSCALIGASSLIQAATLIDPASLVESATLIDPATLVDPAVLIATRALVGPRALLLPPLTA
jgi:UDP-3-O-[3-hydroxymyristoyl] glucosamine N-acyltransferase